jgi:hypothetical protein
MNLLDSLPIQVLCLDKRQDLWLPLLEELKLLSDSVHPFLVGDGELFPKEQYSKINWPKEKMGYWGYGASEHSRWKHWNASISHRMMIENAKQKGWRQFLMLEDDVYITSRFEKVISKFVPPMPFDLMYLGWWIGDENDEWNLKVEENYKLYDRIQPGVCKQIGGLHGVIISESMYDAILSFPWTNPIDMQLNQIHDQINSYFVMPKIIHVKSVYSHCEECTFNRKEL